MWTTKLTTAGSALLVSLFAQSIPAKAQSMALIKAQTSALDRAQTEPTHFKSNRNKSNRRAMTLFTLQDRPVLLAAVTRRGRADTTRRQSFLKENMAMGKVYPGYPQQPFLSFDMQMQF